MMPRLSVAGMTALMVACASVPTVRLHSLLEPGTAFTVAAAAPSWELLTVTLPAQVDQPQWLVRGANGQPVVLEQERWVAPLGEEMRALLGQRIVAAALPITPQRWRIGVDVTRFDALWGRAAQLEATWTVQTLGGAATPVLRCRSSFEAAAAPDMTSLAAAHRANVARLGDVLAAALKQGASASCSSVSS